MRVRESDICNPLGDQVEMYVTERDKYVGLKMPESMCASITSRVLELGLNGGQGVFNLECWSFVGLISQK